jgi:hypothetical protein
MRKSFKILYVVSTIILLYSCTQENEPQPESSPLLFDEIEYELILENESMLSSSPISATNSSGKLIDTGDIFFYVTSEGRFGKFEVLYIAPVDNYNLYIRAVTYDENGKIFIYSDELKVRGTWTADLDEMLESGTTYDFWWHRINDTDTELAPSENARFYQYIQ